MLVAAVLVKAAAEWITQSVVASAPAGYCTSVEVMAGQGMAVQVEATISVPKAPGTKRLKLKYQKLFHYLLSTRIAPLHQGTAPAAVLVHSWAGPPRLFRLVRSSSAVSAREASKLLDARGAVCGCREEGTVLFHRRPEGREDLEPSLTASSQLTTISLLYVHRAPRRKN